MNTTTTADDRMDRGWPLARLDPVRRVRALAAGMPSAGLNETHFDQPFDVVWAFIDDLERSVPAFDDLVADLRIESRTPDPALGIGGERLILRAKTTKHSPAMAFDVEMSEGFCLMQARHRLFVVAMGAIPDERGGTHFAHLEALPRRRGTRWLRPWYDRTTRSDLRGMRRALSSNGA